MYGERVAPLVLTLILGPFMESALRESLDISRGEMAIFFTRPISLVLLIVAAAIVVVPVVHAARRRGGSTEQPTTLASRLREDAEV